MANEMSAEPRPPSKPYAELVERLETLTNQGHARAAYLVDKYLEGVPDSLSDTAKDVDLMRDSGDALAEAATAIRTLSEQLERKET
jgi:hypothetical protein